MSGGSTITASVRRTLDAIVFRVFRGCDFSRLKGFRYFSVESGLGRLEGALLALRVAQVVPTSGISGPGSRLP